MKKHGFLLIVCHLLFTAEAFSGDIGFKQFTTSDGLSNDAVMCMYQDEERMIWLGTRNGLNLYNGNRFITYKYRKGDPNCIQYNNVHSITGNGDGKIYIETLGLSELDTRTGIFKTITTQETQAIYFHERLYVGIERKVFTYERDSLSLLLELPGKDMKIMSIGADDERILVGTEKHGVFCFSEKSGNGHIIETGTIPSMFRDRDGKWWIGSMDDGLYIYDGKETRNLRHREGDPSSLSSDFVRSFCQDRSGRIWIGTFNGLNIYDPAAGRFSHYSDRNGKSGSTSVWCVLCDHQGSIWAGTYFDGVYRFNEKQNIFTCYRSSLTPGQGLSSGLITRFAEDGDGNLWIATDGGGLDMYCAGNNSFRWYMKNGSGNSIAHNNVRCLCYDSGRNALWIGTHMGGISRLDLKDGKFRNYTYSDSNENTLNSDVIKDITIYGDDLMIATERGICIFSPETEKAVRLFGEGDNRIQYANGVTVDSEGRIWVYGGAYGVRVYKPGGLASRGYTPEGLSSNAISHVYNDSKGRIWVCNNKDGIDLYDTGTDSFINLDQERNSLASNCVYRAIELPSGKILFTTDSGFSILNDDGLTFSNYYRKNGMPISSINEKALFVTGNGDILIGGDNGMVSFKEEDLYMLPESYSISPFRLSIHGKDIYPKKNGILSSPVAETEKIVLKREYTMFSIEYVTSDYLSDDEKSLEYFMEGFSKSWTGMEGRPAVSFTYLAPGKYHLTVRQKNSMVETAVSRMEIVVLPPPYRSWWAIMLYILTGGALLFIGIRNYRNHVHLVEALKYEKKHTEDIEELNRSKIRFFTNISHEFRTPLTLICGNVEMLMQIRSFAPAVYNKIVGIYKSSNYLKDLITELLDFSRLENGRMSIKVSEHNIVKFVYEHYLLFKEYARYRKITLDFIKTDESILLWYDPKQMQKVINNLISNAIKHTPEGGRISVVVRRENEGVVIEVNDSGNGIPEQDQQHIFDRFYQSEYQKTPSYSGTGIGLSLTKGIVELHHGRISVYSKPGEGASFKVWMRTGNGHFQENEISDTDEDIILDITTHEIAEMQDIVISEPEGEEQEKTMLIAEDNEDLRKMLTGIFSHIYRTVTASDGKEAWEKVKSEAPDIVISDVLMPGMSGTELCRNIKHNLDTCHIPVVLLTARTTIQQNMEGLYSGADDYISKPFNVNILVARCSNLINNSLKMKEKFSKDIQHSAINMSTNPMDTRLIEQAVKVIEAHIDESDFNVDIMAREIGISRTKLFSKIKSITGQTPGEFILTVRLRYAATLLKENGELNISEISDRLGFSSPRQFSKFFKSKYGTVPQQWRKSF